MVIEQVQFKPSETRAECFLNNAAKTLLLIKDIGIKEIGVTLDFGHAMYSGTNPSEELVLLAESGHPYYIHINDNDGKWDWDFFLFKTSIGVRRIPLLPENVQVSGLSYFRYIAHPV